VGRFRLMLLASVLCTCISLAGWIVAAMTLSVRTAEAANAVQLDRSAAVMTGVIAAVCWVKIARRREDQRLQQKWDEIAGIERECRDALVTTLSALVPGQREDDLGKTVPFHRAPWQ